MWTPQDGTTPVIDATLLRAWAEQFYRERWASTAKVVLSVCVNHGTERAVAWDRAEDAIQDALLRTCRIYGTRPGHTAAFEHFCNYVRRAAINAVQDQARRRPSPERLLEDLAWPEAPEDPRPDMIREALQRLPPFEQQLLVLSYVEEYTLDALADQLLPGDQRSANARRLKVRRRLRGAVAMLRTTLVEWHPEFNWGEE